MPDASTPLTEDNIAEALQAIKDAQPQKKADIVQVFALRLDAVTERSPTSIDQLSPGSIDAITLLIPSLLASPTPTLLVPVLLSLIPAQIKLIANNDATPQKDRARLMVQTIMSPLLERMNDAKDRIHLPAVDNVTSIGLAVFSNWKSGSESLTSDSASSFGKGKERETAQQMFERLLVNAMEGKSSKGKIGGMKVVVGVREKSSALGLRPFMPLLAGFLEDGDSGVREGARSALIALLASPSTPLSARTELKKLMQARNMKTTMIETMIDQINKAALQIANGGNGRPSPSRNPSGASTGGVRNRTVSSKSTGILDDVEIAPVYISTERELETEFAGFLPAFEGKETEHNWLQREKAIERVRGMLVSGVHRQFPGAFIGSLRSSFLTASTKALASLRTTLSVLTIGMYNDLLQELGTSFDPLVELVLSSLAKLAGATKKITAENSQNTIGLIIRKTTCPPKAFISFLSVGVHEKAPQIRGYYARHLKEYLEKHNGARASAWSGEQLGSVSEMLKHLIADGTPAVRETARQAFWQFHVRYPNEATVLQNSLDDGARKLLEKAKPIPAPPSTKTADLAPADQPDAPSSSFPAPDFETSQPAPSTATAPRERKPVSNLMAEMKKKKLAAMRAQATKRNSLEDMLLPETEDSFTPAVFAVQTSAPPPSLSPRRATSPELAKSPTQSRPNLSPSKSQRPSPVKILSGVSKQAQSPPDLPAQIPLPETPVLVDLDSKRNRQSSRAFSTPQPAPNPFEDVFTALGGATPIDEAALTNLDFGSSNGHESLPSTSMAHSRHSGANHDPVSPIVPVVPLALTAPSLSEGETPTANEISTVSVPIPRAVIRTPSRSSRLGSTVLTGRPVSSGKWDAAAQSYRTPPFVDCSLWLTAVRRSGANADKSESRQTQLSQAIEADTTGRRVSASTLQDAFDLLRSTDNETAQTMIGIRDVDGIRRLMAQEGDDRTTDSVQAVVTNLIESANRQFNQTDEVYREAYVVLMWEICIFHRAICNLVDRQIIAALFEVHRLADDRMRRPVAALLALWGQTTPDPLDLLLCEIAEINRRLEPDCGTQWKLLFFGTLAIAVLVLRIPGIVLKEQMPKLSHLVVAGMGSSNIAARQAATVLIVAMEVNIRDQSALFELLPGLTEQQKDLAAYMIKQDLPPASEKVSAANGGVEGGLSKALRRLSAMKL